MGYYGFESIIHLDIIHLMHQMIWHFLQNSNNNKARAVQSENANKLSANDAEQAKTARH